MTKKSKKKNLLVLGANGFIGKNLLNYLDPNLFNLFGSYHLVRPKIKNISLIKVNLLKKTDVEKIFTGMDIVINAAAITTGAKDIVSKPFMHVTDNSIINALVSRVAFEKKIEHVIMLSCTVMYKSSNKPIKEIDYKENIIPYEKYFGAAWMKVYMEKTSEFFSKMKKNKYTIIRHSNVYGPHDNFDLNTSHFMAATIRKTIESNKEIKVWGDGSEKRDLIYVEDLCDFIVKAIKYQKSSFRIYNVGLGIAFPIKKIVKEIIKISKKNILIKWLPSAPTIKTSICLNCDLAKKELGWIPNTTLTEGIKHTISWYLNNEYKAKKKSFNYK